MSESEQLNPLRLLEDEPVPHHKVDQLGLSPFSQVVAETALGTEGPFTIGVFADWGLGKTSILRQAKTQIESLVDEDPAVNENAQKYQNVVTVWFNAWQFEKEEHPLIPLVSTIVREVESAKAQRKNLSEKLQERWSTLTRALRSVAYGVSVNAKVAVPGGPEIAASLVAKEIVDRWEELKPQQDPLLDQSLYFNAFQLLEELVPADDETEDNELPKIVVFIDDLDRCLPDKGLHLLESIKLVLSQRGFVFVLAVDNRILEGYLAKRYEKEFNVKDYKASGTSYLDKIVQLPLYVPSHQSRFDEYITKLLQKKRLQSEVGDQLDKQREILALGSNHNPRSLVRLINNLLIDQRIYTAVLSAKGEKLPKDFLSLSAISRSLQLHLDPPQYKALIGDQDLCDAILEKEKTDTLEKFKETSDKSHLGLGRLSVIDALERFGFIDELLKTDAGKRWLRETDLRDRINQFLVVQRQEKMEAPESEKEIVETAIRNQLGLSEAEQITQELRNQVVELNLSFSTLSDAGLRSLQNLSQLQSLYLAGNQISGPGLEHLQNLSQLQALDLVGNQITDQGLEHLQNLLQLQALDLDGNQIFGPGLEHLRNLSQLQALYLRNNQISGPGLEHLQNLSQLQALDLMNNQISGPGLEHLQNLSQLQALDLVGNQITDQGLEHLQNLSQLQTLYLMNNQITDEALEELREKLPNCKIFA